MNEAQPLSKQTVTETKITSRPKRRFGCGIYSWLLGILIVCILCLAIALGIGYLSGYLKQALCQVVLSTSPLSKQISCQDLTQSTAKVENPNSQYPVKTADSNGNVSVTNATINVADIYDRTTKSVVGIGIKGDNTTTQDQVIGSGFVVSANGLIATNQHVVSDLNAHYYVKFEGNNELVDVKNIYRDQNNDIAIIKIDKQNLTALTLGDSETLKPGQPVAAIGNPLGEFASTVTAGIISGLHRHVQVGDNTFLRSTVKSFSNAIQTDAAINPGNSGGPLLNAAAEVIGINFATISGYNNLSFALPVSILKKDLKDLGQYGKFKLPYLGIEFQPKLVDVSNQVLVGNQVINIDPKGGATNLQVGDIIVQFNDKTFDNNDLVALIGSANIGDSIKLIVIRGTQKLPITVKILEKQ